MKKENENKKMMRNPQGIKVRKCCASCALREILTCGERFCTKRNKKVKKLGLCKNWEIREYIVGAGLKQGRVKSRQYLKFVLNIRLQEQEAIRIGALLPDQVETPEAIRRLFEEQVGLPIFEIS